MEKDVPLLSYDMIFLSTSCFFDLSVVFILLEYSIAVTTTPAISYILSIQLFFASLLAT
jgi:flagellar biosynthesis protein FliP